MDLNKNYKKFNLYSFAGIAQLVERNLAKVEVAGSSPVSRSFLLSIAFLYSNYVKFIIGHLKFKIETGVVPKWLKGKVCKTFIRQFESVPHLEIVLGIMY